MTADELCLEVVRRGLVTVEFDTGIVRAVRYGNRILNGRNTKGYRVATLHCDGFRKQVKLHRLVWIAAHGLPPLDTLIDHRNRCKDDNRLENLRLADPLLNSQNRRRYIGESNPAARISAAVASEIRSAHPALPYSAIARQFGISKSLVAQIVRGELWNPAD